MQHEVDELSHVKTFHIAELSRLESEKHASLVLNKSSESIVNGIKAENNRLLQYIAKKETEMGQQVRELQAEVRHLEQREREMIA